MISISRAGSFRRPVIVIGRWALKFARNARGRDCNGYEANLYRTTTDDRRQMLCPVLWISPGGRLLIMAAAEPMTEMMTLEDYLDLGERWGSDCPFEPKPSDWGWYKGRRVALDYSAPAW
jgi:hypothetical protein